MSLNSEVKMVAQLIFLVDDAVRVAAFEIT